jgi:hypothetical protein
MDLEELAKEIYWAAYDQYIDLSYAHPHTFDKNKAWKMTTPTQREFCLNQARRAQEYMKKNDKYKESGI